MPERSRENQVVSLDLSLEEWWTLHHVLLDRIEDELTSDEPDRVDPPSMAVYRAFETVDSGETSVSVTELTAIQTVLAEYHHSPTWWEVERPQIEQLLHHVSDRLEPHHPPLPAE